MNSPSPQSSSSKPAHVHSSPARIESLLPDSALSALIPERISAVAAATPEAPAVEHDGRAHSFGELDRRSDQLARHLVGLKLPSEAVIGICSERSFDWTVSLLGVWKAGLAYVPLDPAYPVERLRAVLEDAQAKVLLVASDAVASAPTGDWRIESMAVEFEQNGNPQPVELPKVEPDGLAYVLYTSGSTGKPKGVEVTHAGLANHARAVAKLYELHPGDRVLQFASPAFDVAGEELFPTWISGACSLLRAEAATHSMAAFTSYVEDNRISVVNLPSAFWHEWAAELERKPRSLPKALRLVIVGSERALPKAYASWRKSTAAGGHEPRFLNGYGPTETTITATVFEPDPGADMSAFDSLPIGKAIDGVEAFVVDDNGKVVEQGTAGELWIGGAGVSRGYRGRPELNAERFLADPFGRGDGSRVYRSGDRVRELPGGDLEFLGRMDLQVKIRGYRIELGEIERVAESHPGVEECVVAARESDGAPARLVAYTRPLEGAPSAAEFKAFLAEQLPDYMLPAASMALEQFPLNPSGKVDRKALPEPDWSSASGGAYSAPEGESEEYLATLYAQLLGLERVGRNDNFFALGGHSLLATRMVARVAEDRSLQISLPEIFSHPTPAELARVLAGESTSKAIVLPPIERVPRGGPLAIAPIQEPLWFLLQLAPNNLAYNTQLSVQLRGPLDHAAIEGAFSDIVERHEVLRTTFEEIDGRAMQRIHPPEPVRIPLVDFSELPQAEREQAARNRAESEVRRPFNVGQLPLARWVLLKLGENQHELVQTEHHFVHDGASIALLLAEMVECYRARTEGRPAELPELPVQFADFAAWQRAWLESPLSAPLIEYWVDKLKGAPPLLELPTDRPRPKLQTFAGNTQVLLLTNELYSRIAERAREMSATPYMLMMAAFKLLLSRYSGQEDLVVATTAANRRRRELEPMIGMVVNAMVLRSNLSGNPSFREWVARVRETALEAYEHQDLPFKRIVEALDPERNFAYNPIFQVMFSFHDNPVPDLAMGALQASVDYTHNGSAKFDMNLIIIPRGEQRVGRARSAEDNDAVIVEWEYNTDLFDHATIEGMLRHYRHLLEQVVANPDRALDSYELMEPEEARALIEQHNPEQTSFPSTLRALDLIDEQAGRSPDACALRFETNSLTYAELESESKRVAAKLIGAGVNPGELVALCSEPCLELVPIMLGIWRAGAAYVPLDPAHPLERLQWIVEDSDPRVLCLGPGVDLAGELSQLGAGRTRLTTQDLFPNGLATTDTSADAVSFPAGDAGDLAYTIYTSGSTGRPKGVEIEHRSLVNFLHSMAMRPGLDAQDVLAAVTTFAFDISLLELFGPLTRGGQVVLIPRSIASDGHALATELERVDATLLQATPATWQMLLDAGWTGSEKLRALSGGEALPPELARKLIPKTRELWNMYGPTETTIWSACGRVELDPTGELGAIHLGTPIANTSLCILDDQQRPVPYGVIGELAIGGAGLARGYHNRPDLTQERFVPDPRAASAGERLYRTGDLARRTRDGQLHFLGRGDQQVKLRGFRIELGEIEAALNSHQQVAECAVSMEGDQPGTARLIGYIVPVKGASAEVQELRAHLAERLPSYMLPSVFVSLDALPLTPNGKLDRRALPPAPDSQSSSQATNEDAPTTPTEKTLARLWCEILELESVGRFDNFFDLGGHSLQSVRLLVRIEEELGLRPSPRQLMLQTLAQLGAACDERSPSGAPEGGGEPQATAGVEADPQQNPNRRRGLGGFLSRLFGAKDS